MATNTRRERWLLTAGALSVLFILSALVFLSGAPVKPAVVQQAAAPAPVAAEQAPPSPQARAPQLAQAAPAGVRHDYIVQASSVDLARNAVVKAGGVVTGELDIIRAVGAALDDRELAALWEDPVLGLRVYDDSTVTASGAAALPETYYPTEVGASTMHKGGLTGRGVTVAVLDSGVWREKGRCNGHRMDANLECSLSTT